MSSGDENIIHVVLAVYDPKGTYSQHAGVVMASIFERTQSPVCVHILHDETLMDRNRSLLAETAESFGQTVSFYDVSIYMERLGDETIQMVQKNGWSVGTLFRLAITDILSLDKVIYLDCDIAVNMDIRELWDIPLGDSACAGVLNPHRGRFSSVAFRKKLVGCDEREYINAGVLLMNIPRMREKLDFDQVCRWFGRYRYYAELQDQDLINSCFRGEIKILEDRFNFHHADRIEAFQGDIHASGAADSIFHATLAKPWNQPRGSVVDRLYWRAFLKTPWGRLTNAELADLMIDVFLKSPLTHRRTGQCYRKIFRRIKNDIFSNDIFKTAALFLKALFHETKYLLMRERQEEK